MVSVLPKDLLHTIFSYTESKVAKDTLWDTLQWAMIRLVEIEESYGSLPGEAEIECVFVCNKSNITTGTAWWLGDPWGPVFGKWEPNLVFGLRHHRRDIGDALSTPEVYSYDLKVEWEDWSDPTTSFVYRNEVRFREGENPFANFDLGMTAPRSAGECDADALLAFYAVNVDICDPLELEMMELDCGLVMCKQQYQIYRGKELAEFVLE